MLRIVLIPLLVIFLIDGSYLKALLVFSITSITDALDGFLARTLRMQTELGAYLDPIADKAMISSCYITLAITGGLPAWLTVLVIGRDLIIIIGILVFFLVSLPVTIKPALVSKITTIFQILTVLWVLVTLTWTWEKPPVLVTTGLFWMTAALTVASGLVYLHRGIQIINHQGSKS
jgi:cardiolipin synthase